MLFGPHCNGWRATNILHVDRRMYSSKWRCVAATKNFASALESRNHRSDSNLVCRFFSQKMLPSCCCHVCFFGRKDMLLKRIRSLPLVLISGGVHGIGCPADAVCARLAVNRKTFGTRLQFGASSALSIQETCISSHVQNHETFQFIVHVIWADIVVIIVRMVNSPDLYRFLNQRLHVPQFGLVFGTQRLQLARDFPSCSSLCRRTHDRTWQSKIWEHGVILTSCSPISKRHLKLSSKNGMTGIGLIKPLSAASSWWKRPLSRTPQSSRVQNEHIEQFSFNGATYRLNDVKKWPSCVFLRRHTNWSIQIINITSLFIWMTFIVYSFSRFTWYLMIVWNPEFRRKARDKFLFWFCVMTWYLILHVRTV